MNKLTCLALILAWVLGLASCGSTEQPESPDQSTDGFYQQAPVVRTEESAQAEALYEGCWVCSGMRVKDTERTGQELEEHLTLTPEQTLSLKITNGTATVTLRCERFQAPCVCSDSALTLMLDPEQWPYVGSDTMTFLLEDDGRLSYKESSATLLLSRVDETASQNS